MPPAPALVVNEPLKADQYGFRLQKEVTRFGPLKGVQYVPQKGKNKTVAFKQHEYQPRAINDIGILGRIRVKNGLPAKQSVKPAVNIEDDIVEKSSEIDISVIDDKLQDLKKPQEYGSSNFSSVTDSEEERQIQLEKDKLTAAAWDEYFTQLEEKQEKGVQFQLEEEERAKQARLEEQARREAMDHEKIAKETEEAKVKLDGIMQELIEVQERTAKAKVQEELAKAELVAQMTREAEERLKKM